MVSYTMEGETSAVLHAREIDANAMERLELFREGLKTLAGKVMVDEKFHNTEDVLLLSWAVTKLKPVITGLGFEIDSEKQHPLYTKLLEDYRETEMLSRVLHRYKNIEPSLAVMKKETLLDKYGPTAKTPVE